MFIGFLSFSGSLESKSMSLNDGQWKTRPALISLNPAKLNYYQFIISLDKCNGVVIHLLKYLAELVSQTKQKM